MKKWIAIISSALLVAVIAVGCSNADVVLKYSPKSFDSIVKAFPNLITDKTQTEHYYYLTVDGITTLKISHDYDYTAGEDIVMETPLEPFVNAGLDPSKLGAGYRVDGGKLLLVDDYGKGTGMKENVVDSLFESVKYDRKLLTFHQALDHFGVKLTGGKFEWAKDYTKNDKDIVFVIGAKPLADIGVNVQNIEGWAFKTMQDESGKDIDVLLKPYDLK